MKRTIIAPICLVLALALALLGYWDLQSTANQLQAQCTALANTVVQNGITAGKQPLDKFVQQYASASTRLGMYVNHSELDEAEILVRGLFQLQADGETEEFLEALYAIRCHFAHLADAETPVLKNIF